MSWKFWERKPEPSNTQAAAERREEDRALAESFRMSDAQRIKQAEAEVARTYNQCSTLGHGDICYCLECARYREARRLP